MLAFGLNKKLCSDFLKKQAVIGNLDEGELSWGVGRDRAGRLHWGCPPCQKEGICHRNLSPWPAFFPKPMEHILWLCNWKLLLLRDGGWHVTQPGQRWPWHSVSLVQSKTLATSWYLLECHLFCPHTIRAAWQRVGDSEFSQSPPLSHLRASGLSVASLALQPGLPLLLLLG